MGKTDRVDAALRHALDHDLTIESGELPPSMKVKRNVVEDNHAALIDGMYAE